VLTTNPLLSTTIRILEMKKFREYVDLSIETIRGQRNLYLLQRLYIFLDYPPPPLLHIFGNASQLYMYFHFNYVLFEICKTIE
jgi:hypothetical protein